ncbi:MAG: diacylglycerol kinase family lipid kinase [Ruminococcus sp.]|nr:diacylglycerol kinase family lipid kinase [Ruminococcus sp.]
MTHLFILNRFAGTKDHTPELKEKIRALHTDDEVVMEYTKEAGDAKRIAKEYAEKCQDLRVYACGGDGTANEALTGLMGYENASLGVIPVGTGNDLIRSLPASKEDFLDLQKMIEGDTVRIDLFRCEDKYAINVISVGYDCEVAAQAQRNKRLPLMSGSFAYKLAILQCLLTKRKHTFRPFADGEEIQLKDGYKTQMLAVASNGRYYGGGIQCSPKAELNDGYIDFMSIPTISVPKFLSLVSDFIKGQHIDNPKMPFILNKKCKEMKLIDDKELKVGIDGEMFYMTNPTITVLPSAFDVIVPKNLP